MLVIVKVLLCLKRKEIVFFRVTSIWQVLEVNPWMFFMYWSNRYWVAFCAKLYMDFWYALTCKEIWMQMVLVLLYLTRKFTGVLCDILLKISPGLHVALEDL